MSNSKATTMELPVKLVRKIARLAFNFQRDVLQKDVEKIAADENARIEISNQSFLRSLGVFKMETPYNMATIYQEWKQLYLSGKMRGDHPAIGAFWRKGRQAAVDRRGVWPGHSNWLHR